MSSLYPVPRAREIKEERRERAYVKPEDGQKHCETRSSGHAMAIACKNSHQMWVPMETAKDQVIQLSSSDGGIVGTRA